MFSIRLTRNAFRLHPSNAASLRPFSSQHEMLNKIQSKDPILFEKMRSLSMLLVEKKLVDASNPPTSKTAQMLLFGKMMADSEVKKELMELAAHLQNSPNATDMMSGLSSMFHALPEKEAPKSSGILNRLGLK